MSKFQKILIWDFPTRLFHWLLTLCIVAQWLTSELGGDLMDWHFVIGYFTLGLILFRLVWGFIGPKHARFNQFLVSPNKLIQYLKTLRRGNAPNYVGHNPIGGLIVPLIIVVIGLQVISGLFASDDVFYSGPYMASISAESQALMDWLHSQTFDVITVIIVIHILALLWHRFIAKHHLISAMFTGKKEAPKDQGIASSQVPLAILIVLLVGAIVLAIIALAPEPAELYF